MTLNEERVGVQLFKSRAKADRLLSSLREISSEVDQARFDCTISPVLHERLSSIVKGALKTPTIRDNIVKDQSRQYQKGIEMNIGKNWKIETLPPNNMMPERPTAWGVRATHISTGISEECYNHVSQRKNMLSAIELVKEIIEEEQ